MPARKPQSGTAPLGAVLPIGGSPVICDVERSADLPTMVCGLADKITGPNDALNVHYATRSYGVRISKRSAALIRWYRDGTYSIVTRHAEPSS
jgi:hypothetical protein